MSSILIETERKLTMSGGGAAGRAHKEQLRKKPEAPKPPVTPKVEKAPAKGC